MKRDGRRGERSFNALGPTVLQVLSHSLTVHAERETREAEFNTVYHFIIIVSCSFAKIFNVLMHAPSP